MAEWPHAPIHELGEHGAYMVTAGTYRKQPFFASAERLDLLHDQLLSLARRYAWRLQAWAVFSNHYHFVAVSPESAANLRDFVRHLHSETARNLNQLDSAPGRRVWFNYWDTFLSYQRSYLARLQYVHENAVHHRIASHAAAYPWCSARWFEASSDPGFYRTVASFKVDRLKVRDDFDVARVD